MPAHRRPIRILAATAALAVAVPLAGCGALQGLLGGSAPEPKRDDTTQEIVEEGDADVFAIRVGDCLDQASGEVVSEVPVVPCDQPHDEEVFFDFELEGSDYPGDDAVQTQANDGCLAQFEAFVGLAYESSTLDFYPYTPTQQSWDELGDRIVSCVIWDPAGQVTGSLAGAAY